MVTLDRRRAGVLLHLSSLDAGDGRGALGVRARSFIDWLADAGTSLSRSNTVLYGALTANS